MIVGYFFCLFIHACDLCRSWRRIFYPIFLSAVHGVAARSKLPFALRPGLSQKDKVRTKGITKESNKGKATIPYPSSTGAMKEGVGVGTAAVPPRHPILPQHPALPPPPPVPLPAPGAPGATTLTPDSRHHPLPETAPAFTHPLRRGSPAPPVHISHRQVDPGSSITSRSPSALPPTESSVASSIADTP